ncbi:xylulokinase [Streptomyces thermoviolaceus]|mgnify:CR=1 FL=1|uniref:Xylulose kinase n=1 Tax=Streptomyces thermoviolaceus subsp. thermoviolaceus TaxID=66860 RepID=A0ABX0YUC6_STRTL|nr:xylulokinase [Streptomyces thermoviolaceus]MCM3262715.1 xylulokinase [Streptomyces thermoviolaceus]NJP14856.1 xylulokinase [Streptomyces thermoviolaceus subsp. thermoviolaceus]WTD50229.1 xylulokinase [Streptomyces thermoviolaceus]GHA99420.1 xylulose kinase [Streptomyces thermoviolaceus subsp. thermoviolaceus]
MSAAEGPLVVGVDSSTQSTKALVVDTATGRVVASGQAPHTVSTGDGRESDPRQWWQALCAALRQCGEAAHEAAAVSIAGQQHGLVTLDDRGEPVRPALLWNDVRSAPQARRLVEELGGPKFWAERVGSVPGASFTVTKWAWLTEHEPEAARRVAAVRLPHDYLTERLTGQGTTDRGDASGTGWWASSTEAYDEEILARVGLDPALLPRVVRPGEVAGTVRDGHEDLPFSRGTLVAAGTGDNAAAALGLGLRPGSPVLSLGTSGTVYTVSGNRPADPSGTVAGFADAHGAWLPLACTLNCTLAVDRIAALFGLDREAVEPGGSVTVLPYLDGERTPNLPEASGLLHGLRHDTTPGQVLQAAYDGAVHALLEALDLVLDQDADRTSPLLLIGGGARGTAWQQTVRRLSGRPVQVPQARELVALGAAAQAAGLLTGEDPAAVARRWKTADGPVLEPVERDEATLERISGVLSDATPLLERGPHHR